MGSASLTGGCLEGVQGPPCRGSGCPRKTLFLSFCLAPTAAREKKRGFWGPPRPRQRAGRPLHSRVGGIHQLREYYLVMGEEKIWKFFSSPITNRRVGIPWGAAGRSLTHF